MPEAAATAATAVPKSLRHAPAAEPESPSQIDARETRAKLGAVVDALMTLKVQPLKRLGAALFATHIAIDKGMIVASRMSREDVEAYATGFRARFPAAWYAAAISNVVSFVNGLRLARLIDRDDDRKRDVELRASQIVEYQAMQSILL